MRKAQYIAVSNKKGYLVAIRRDGVWLIMGQIELPVIFKKLAS